MQAGQEVDKDFCICSLDLLTGTALHWHVGPLDQKEESL